MSVNKPILRDPAFDGKETDEGTLLYVIDQKTRFGKMGISTLNDFESACIKYIHALRAEVGNLRACADEITAYEDAVKIVEAHVKNHRALTHSDLCKSESLKGKIGLESDMTIRLALRDLQKDNRIYCIADDERIKRYYHRDEIENAVG